ncbi:HlyD family secretion protein [Celeribacter indicus]|uniref:HlyD family secretion protein n=1 Tax=Celeribacter indicus TaxID=1208324 RepID=A0A0B5DRF2_9RHOB|nr:HlyD family secretion protein [Celeribacter indicus]AJE46123.1 HlyD family secretion protein [Celeribacter indicus]SDX37460.1 Multidrug resistance efflux pump [Celeribacter indicus]
MISKYTRHIATTLAILVGVLGVLGVLFAWGLPPFRSDTRMTEDAYVRGQVTTLAPQISGVVAEVAVQDFERVSRGDVLIRLDDATYAQQLAQVEAQLDAAEAALDTARQDRRSAEAGVASAEASVDSARAALKVAEADLDRSRELLARGVTTEREGQRQQLVYDQARTTLRKAEAEAETARQTLASVAAERQGRVAAVEEAKAAVELARINLRNTVITAPVDGRLGDVSARVGQYVGAGTRLVSLVPDQVWVIANFKETQLAGMDVGQKVSFAVDAFGGKRLNGHIERFAPATGSEFSVLGAANATGNFIKVVQRLPVRIGVDPGQPEADKLTPGMSVVVEVDTGS